jgi:hypothetical protein
LKVLCLFVVWASLGCETGAPEAPNARRMVREQDGPRVAQVVIDDLVRHEKGLKIAAKRIGAGFVKVEGEKQEKEMRSALKVLRSPKRGVRELIVSPMSFMAAVNKAGVVVARNAEPDRMKGMNLASMFPVVEQALLGKTGYAIGEFKSTEKDGKPSVTIVMATPSYYGEDVVGALVLGIPLWRLQQRLSKQLQMEAASGDAGMVLWVYVYRGEELHHHGTPRDLDMLVPDAATRKAGLANSPGGFTGEVVQYGFWYGYGVRPIRVLGDDIGVIIFRMEPEE